MSRLAGQEQKLSAFTAEMSYQSSTLNFVGTHFERGWEASYARKEDVMNCESIHLILQRDHSKFFLIPESLGLVGYKKKTIL